MFQFFFAGNWAFVEFYSVNVPRSRSAFLPPSSIHSSLSVKQTTDNNQDNQLQRNYKENYKDNYKDKCKYNDRDKKYYYKDR